MKTTIFPLRHSIQRSPERFTFLLIPLALAFACFALSPAARAVDPPPDGGYPNQNTAEGQDALFSLTTGIHNTAIGFDALYNSTDGSYNTATGYTALFSNTIGENNTANGWEALMNNTTGSNNTAIGYQALYLNTTGINNTAIGFQALSSSDFSFQNTGTGFKALAFTTLGLNNTANGAYTLYYNTNGTNNTATGAEALFSNTRGNRNTANGSGALEFNTSGSYNTAIGYLALDNNTSGGRNIALGQSAGANLTTGSGNIDIGNAGVGGEANTIRIGTTGAQTSAYIAGISGVTVPAGVGVIVGTDGHLGTVVSSQRFKDEVKPMDKASEAILALKPVTFRYKKELDSAGIPQFGLVAEDVEKVDSDLVARDDEGNPYTVRYDAVNAMLLNEFLKGHKAFRAEHRKVQEQGAAIARLEQQMETLAAGLQKVSAPLETNKMTARPIVANQ